MSEAARRILIVEDQRLIAADLENTLKKLGYVVVGNVASGEEAISTSDQVRPELVLMDVRLRGEMDGRMVTWSSRSTNASCERPSRSPSTPIRWNGRSLMSERGVKGPRSSRFSWMASRTMQSSWSM